MTNFSQQSVMDKFLEANREAISFLKVGDLVEGEIISQGRRALFVDLGSFGTGIIYGLEFLNAKDVIKNLKAGDKIVAKVVDLENEKGYIELSLKEADKQKIQQRFRDLREKEEVIKAKVIGANRGGLIIEFEENRGFMPVSQLSSEHYPRVSDADKNKIFEELKKFVGQEIKCKIIDFNPRGDKLIFSEREAVETDVKELISAYQVGDVVDGVISGIANFGVFFRFIDKPEIEGLIHISELDHRLIESPKEVVKVGDLVKAQIIEIKDNRISLSLKALKVDPWEKVAEHYQVGQVIDGEVFRFNPFGALIKLDPDFQGLIHVSEFGSIEKMKEQLVLGRSYKFVIDLINPQEKRLLLKLKND